MKKRIFSRLMALLLTGVLLLPLAACGAGAPVEESTAPSDAVTEQTLPEDAALPTEKATTPTAPKPTEPTPPTGEPATEPTEPAPADPQPTEPEAPAESTGATDNNPPTEAPATEPAPTGTEAPRLTCTISIRCDTILDNMDLCNEAVRDSVPGDGVVLSTTTVPFTEGETVLDVLQRVCRDRGISMEFSNSAIYGSAYIEGIANLYEYDVGAASGWMYRVNGTFPNYGCSKYVLGDGDTIQWIYTCDLGDDVGGSQNIR